MDDVASGRGGGTSKAVRMDPSRTFRRVPLAPHQLLERITPQRDLFVLGHVGIPRADAESWTLRVTGLLWRLLAVGGSR